MGRSLTSLVSSLAVCLLLTPIVASAQARPARSTTQMICGADRIFVRIEKALVRVDVGGQVYEMRQVTTASGARYEVANDPTTSFWSKGRHATLTIKGKVYPECMPMLPPTRAFSASGNEPGWRLDIADGQLTLVADNGATKLTLPAPQPEAIAGGRKFTGRSGGQSIEVTVFDQTCVDSMTGMPRPNTVEVMLDGKILKGCGGDAASLLQGATWVVQDINGAAPLEGSRVTMIFVRGGRISGDASCNTYRGLYTLTPESLTIDNTAGTLRACSPPLMTQENAFFEILRNVRRFEVRPDGALVLHAGDGRTLTARK